MRNASGRPRFSASHYEGLVYCLSVPNTTLMVRRGGSPLIAGNCMEYLCAYEPKYHQPPKSFGPEPWWVKWLADKPRRLGLQDESCVILGPMGYQKR